MLPDRTFSIGQKLLKIAKIKKKNQMRDFGRFLNNVNSEIEASFDNFCSENLILFVKYDFEH